MKTINRGSDIPPSCPVEWASPSSATEQLNENAELSSDVQKPDKDQARASGATKEAAASKIAEQKLAGQAQEARLRSHVCRPSPLQSSVMVNGKPVYAPAKDEQVPNIMSQQSGTVQINGKEAHRKDENNCHHPKDTIK